ncbi:unnamed protein product [Acanthoscelides obtectus]|uniref:Uncharacterized protein n=1 Tax=Acanthoscelides obtectus TaxID=200917 RepID=A0A9P0PH03_ACAOB|nr:unnamed protein product [Acanthoscelides obtectus]CAK1655189.1 RYamide neuropeptides [Acanthoscelides obtectus]
MALWLNSVGIVTHLDRSKNRNMHARRVVILFVYLSTVFLAVAIAKGYPPDKRIQSPSSFKTMLRFGRSSNSNSDKDLKPVNVYPRADAFFLGPRYGKRSVWGPNPLSMTCGEESDMSCSWVGLSNLYRCIQSLQ